MEKQTALLSEDRYELTTEFSPYRISKSTLYHLHQSHVSKGKSYESDASRIVEALGGIDELLSVYLSNDNNIAVPENQIQQLHEILAVKSCKSMTLQQSESKYVQIVPDRQYFHRFDVEDTLAVALLKEGWTEWIYFLLHHRLTHFFTIISYYVWFALYLTNSIGDETNKKKDVENRVFQIYGVIVAMCCWIPCEILVILSANRKAAMLIFYSFEFWLKVCCSVNIAVLISIYWFHRYGILDLIGNMLFGISHIGFVICIGLMDAIQCSKCWRVTISGAVGLVAGLASLNYRLILANGSDYIVKLPWINGSFSFCSMIGSADRILAIFLLRQSLCSYYWVNQCVSIKYRPHVFYRHRNSSWSWSS